MQRFFAEALGSPEMRHYLNFFTNSLTGKRPDGTMSPWKETERADWTGTDTLQMLRSMTRVAQPYYVSPDMQAIVTAAAMALPDDEVVTVEDFPADVGWMLIPGGGITVIDIRGKLVSSNVLLWRRLGSVVTLVLLVDEKHSATPDLGGGFGGNLRVTPWMILDLHLGRPLPTNLSSGMVVPPELADQFTWIDTPTGGMMTHPKGFDASEMTYSLRPDYPTQWLVACLRIMQQPLARITQEGLPTALRKGLKASPVRLRYTHVTVIDYRRRVGDPDRDPSGRTFSHRFLRTGHWRRQPYKREDGSWDHRRTWIHLTIVGDPSLPLMLREHVRALTR